MQFSAIIFAIFILLVCFDSTSGGNCIGCGNQPQDPSRSQSNPSGQNDRTNLGQSIFSTEQQRQGRQNDARRQAQRTSSQIHRQEDRVRNQGHTGFLQQPTRH
ncbi:hypothetical protein niasHT_009100 [Heterodera trifolii]|uniref:Secreted protein n=1 Tax=Heterodera trifolii TaxID=157864 RepID=A0ABD2M5Q8_9BILA